MLTLYISPREQPIITDDGLHMVVREMCVQEGDGFRSLQDCERFSDLSEVEIVVTENFFTKKLRLTPTTEKAIIQFLQCNHAQQDVSFDCYTFANLVKGIEPHKVPYMLNFWDTKPKGWRLAKGSVIFLTSGKNHFHHAAIYLSGGFFISVYGAGGDLEISLLKDMVRDFKAESVLVANPKE